MPYTLCVTIAESRGFVQVQAQYRDGATDRSQLARTSRRTFELSQRLIASRVIAMKAFWDGQQGGGVPFLFYNLGEAAYDATGNSTQGRYTVVFRGNWSQATSMLRTDVPQIDLVEVAESLASISDAIGRISVPALVDSGVTFPLTSDSGYGFTQERPVVVHQFGELDAKAEQRFAVGIAPRKVALRHPVPPPAPGFYP